MSTVQTPTSQAPVVPQTGIIKNLLIKDASGNTQLIEVIQTAPGKFVTASGHSIKTSTGVGGARTIVRATAATATQQSPGQQGTQPPSSVVRTATPATIVKSGGQQVRLITTAAAVAQSPGGAAQLIKPITIKSEFPPAPAQTPPARQHVLSSPMMQQLITTSTNQRLLLTQTASGPQLTPITTLPHPISGHQLATFVQQQAQLSPNQSGGGGPTLNLKQTFISPILDHTGARKRVDFANDVSYEAKRRKAEKGGKGLRHFSMKVCEKVRTKGTTTYNEVADELVSEFAAPAMGMSSIEQQFDQKNIRRRVYDALNVLMAMNIISKEKKEIRWLGLPTNSMQECTTLEKDRSKRIERLKAKTKQLHDLIVQQVAFKSLVERNKEREKAVGPPSPHGSIHLPFLIVNTAKSTVIDCSISTDKMEYLFNFDSTFEIHDDIEVLKRMGLALGLDKGDCSDADLARAKAVLPKSLAMYIDQIGKRDEDWRAEFEDLDFEDSYFPPDEFGDDGAGAEMLGMSVEDLEMQAAIDSLDGAGEEELDEEEDCCYEDMESD